ncbi:MAG: DEAD/DEAH box helicase [Clostridiales bacterium]|nr:DEAD/DEAH box helicase [Clostridiales bacterium]
MTREDIFEFCDDYNIFSEGNRIAAEGCVENLWFDQTEETDEVAVQAQVREKPGKGRRWETVIWYNRQTDTLMDYNCDCMDFFFSGGMCSHCVALALEWMRCLPRYYPDGKEGTPVRSSEMILNMIREFSSRKRLEEQKPEGKIELVPSIVDRGQDYYGRRKWTLTFRIGAEKKYVLKNLEDFAQAVNNEEKYTYGKNLSFVHSKSAFTEEGWKYAELILAACEESPFYSLHKELELTDGGIVQMLLFNLNRELTYERLGRRFKTLKVIDANPPAKLELTGDARKGFLLKIPEMDLISGECLFALIDNKAYRCTREYGDMLLQVRSVLLESRHGWELEISGEDMPAFCGTVLPELERTKLLREPEISLENYRPREAKISCYLDEDEERVTAQIWCSYGEPRYNLLAPRRDGEYHDRAVEQKALDLARAYFPLEDLVNEKLYFPSGEEDRMFQLLDTGITQLNELGEVYVSDSLRRRKLIRSPKVRFGISLYSGLLEFQVESQEFSREDLSGILDSYRKKKKYYRMKNGDFLNLEDNSVSAVAEVLDGLGMKSRDFEEETLHAPKYRACFVDQVLRKNSGRLQVDRNPDYRAVIRSMKNVEDSDYAVPESLSDILRGYQKTGYRWLRTLGELGFGGILADDMGLGKTLQAIAYILSLRDSELPALVVCPASLVYNWEKEFQRFAPELQVAMIAGSAANRVQTMENSTGAHVWITSYDMLKRDIDEYGKYSFSTEFIDEAQNIKNQGTQAARAVKAIHSRVRFALTGTPIENRLSELWSIFDYLMPGILGSSDSFRKNYEIPIMQNQDKDRARRLNRMISPFVLRRCKKDVLKELPDKVEQVVYAQMEPEQRKLYLSHVERMVESLQNRSEEEVKRGKLEILAELTRLRQLCCDPALIYENYTARACKVDICLELVHEAIQGNHKVLIFSQFPSMFPALQAEFDREKIAYYTLTGATSKRKRMEMAESFNQDQVPVFLISLKAGGTGLNLTGASIVIHFDPWWNLAAQTQATDRAHRIGQAEQVVVFKIIARDTIEEKILGLQEKKQEIADQILGGDAIAASSLTKEDLLEILEQNN